MRRLWIPFLCLLTAGCGTTTRLFTGEVYRVDTPWYDSRTDRLDPADASDSLVDIATYCFREDASGSRTGDLPTCGVTAYARAQASAIDRDRLQDVLLDASNRECDEHKSGSVGTNTGFNLGLSMLSSLLSGAATGFSATTTKTALSAAATFFSSTRAQLNEQVYRQLFVGTVLTAIDNDRQAQLLDIMARRRYPVPKDAWDPRASGQPLELGSVDRTVGESRVAAESVTGQPQEPSVRIEDAPGTEGEVGEDVGPAEEETQQEVAGSPRSLEDVELKLEPEERELAAAGDDTRRFYGIDEAIRDAAVYHSRCSFYNGLVRLSTKVEEFSPCRLIEERRERLLAEVAAIQAANVQGSPFEAKHKAYTSELEALNTKMASCASGGGG